MEPREVEQRVELVARRILAAEFLCGAVGVPRTRCSVSSDGAFRGALQDGALLAQLAQALGGAPLPERTGEAGSGGARSALAAFESVAAFRRVCVAAGLPETAIFSKGDLDAAEERPSVVETLLLLRTAVEQEGRFLASAPSSLEPDEALPVSCTPQPRESLFSLGLGLLRDAAAHSNAVTEAAVPPQRGWLSEEPVLIPVLEGVLSRITQEYERRMMRKENELLAARDAVAQAEMRCAEAIAAAEAPPDAEDQEEGAAAGSPFSPQQRTPRTPRAPASPLTSLSALREGLRALRADALAASQAAAHGVERASALLHPLAARAARADQLAADNRALHAKLLETTGAVRVACRLRPPAAQGEQLAVAALSPRDQWTPCSDVRVRSGPRSSSDAPAAFKTFSFDRVFAGAEPQASIFEMVAPLVRCAMEGVQSCILAHGPTGSGKTHTMYGPPDRGSGDFELRGVAYRALDLLFELAASRAGEVRYTVSCQCVEVYLDTLRDLLAPECSPALDVKLAGGAQGLAVPDAVTVVVRDAAAAYALLSRGEAARAVGRTALNARSSRSHAVLLVHVQGDSCPSPQGHQGRAVTTRGCLHLVDLAGSERLSRSGASGEALKETQAINKSLAALGDVMAALQLRSEHVPYRNSKLTSLLAAPLGAGGRALILAHVAPESCAAGETLCTLGFAARVRAVELGSARRVSEDAGLREELTLAQQRAERAERLLSDMQARTPPPSRPLRASESRGSSPDEVEAHRRRPASAGGPRNPQLAGSPSKPPAPLRQAHRLVPTSLGPRLTPPPLRAEKSSPALLQQPSLTRATTPGKSGGRRWY
jgi:hypothetical protein